MFVESAMVVVYVSMENNVQCAKNVEDRAYVSITGYAPFVRIAVGLAFAFITAAGLYAESVKDLESANMTGSKQIAESAKEQEFVITIEFDSTARNASK
eukprot:768091-Hanusia_phi.AAC.2